MGDKSRFLTLFTALVAGSFGVRSVTTHAQTAGSSQTARSITPRAERSMPQGLLTTFSDFDTSSVGEASHCSAPALGGMGGEMEWAIATVPDPERSNLKLDFDREIEAIQNAAASMDYQFERFWFPWHTESSADSKTDESASAGQRRESDTVPGVLLFRKHGGSHHSSPGLAIFLVGETPTSGINPGQFRSAVCLGKSLHGNAGNTATIRIIGPGYSANFESLARLVDGATHLKVRSWTADFESQKTFEDRTHADLKTTRTPSILSINSFVRFLRSDWHETGPVVILKEEGTALGAGIKRTNCEESTSGKDEQSLADCKVRPVEFPRNLSSLRNASENQAATAPPSSADPQIPRTGLTLSLKGDNASFEIPVFSQAQTPVSQESVLFSISNLLKTGTVHYAGIVASDPLDVLYLSRYLRSACPNLRLFVLNPDLLLEHGSDSSDFESILSVTTYPLLPMSQVWTRSSGPLQVFPSESYEAVYNAVLSSLSESDPTRSDPTKYVDLWNPIRADGSSRMPLWLTVAARNGFEPVALLKPTAGTFTIKPTPVHPRFIPEYWDSWGYTFTILLAACLLFCFAIAAASPGGDRRASVFAVKPQEEGASSRALYLSAIGACLSLLAFAWLAVAGEVILLNIPEAVHPSIGRWFGFWLFCLGALAAGTILAATANRRHGNSASVSQWRLRDLVFPRRPAPLAGFSCSTVLLAMSLIFAFPEPFKTESGYVVQQLWHLFSMGSFVLGAIVVATACPVWDLLRSGPGLAQVTSTQHSRAEVRQIWVPAFGAFSIATCTALFALSGFVLFMLQSPNGASNYFFLACRSLNLTSGVSPLIPLSLVVIVMLSLASVHLKRLVYYEDHCPTVPYLRRGEYCPRLRVTVAETRRRTSRLSFHTAYGVAFLAFAFVAYRIWNTHTHETLETPALEQLLIYTSLVAGFLLLLVWIRVLLIWSSFSEFLQQLERHPLRNVFSLLPKGFVWSPVWQGGGKKRTHVAITRSLECILALHSHDGTPARLKAVIESRLDAIRRQVKEVLQISASRRRIPRLLFRELERNLSEVAAAAADYLESQQLTEGGSEVEGQLSARAEKQNKAYDPASICRELIAFRFLTFINYVLWQLDNLVGFLSFGFLLLVVALNSYGFRSRTIIDWMLVLTFVLLTSGVMAVFAQVARDGILSRITGTKEGKLDLNFFVHLVAYGALPVLVLVATHFPTVGKFFFSWVQPALEAIH